MGSFGSRLQNTFVFSFIPLILLWFSGVGAKVLLVLRRTLELLILMDFFNFLVIFCFSCFKHSFQRKQRKEYAENFVAAF